jgi:hypothetical protein
MEMSYADLPASMGKRCTNFDSALPRALLVFGRVDTFHAGEYEKHDEMDLAAGP